MGNFTNSEDQDEMQHNAAIYPLNAGTFTESEDPTEMQHNAASYTLLTHCIWVRVLLK